VLVVGIIVPVTMRMREKGRQTVCLSNLKQLGMAVLAYAQDNDGYLPPFKNILPGPDWWESSDPTSGYAAPWLLYAALWTYVKNRAVWFCPNDPFAGRNVDRWQVNHFFSSYYFNFRRGLRLRDDGFWTNSGSVIEPSEYPLIRDPNMGYVRPRDPGLTPGGEHFGGVNVFYLDGHIRWRKE
jgi:prepilin-type processing-associated H-X9-DG protein